MTEEMYLNGVVVREVRNGDEYFSRLVDEDNDVRGIVLRIPAVAVQWFAGIMGNGIKAVVDMKAEGNPVLQFGIQVIGTEGVAQMIDHQLGILAGLSRDLMEFALENKACPMHRVIHQEGKNPESESVPLVQDHSDGEHDSATCTFCRFVFKMFRTEGYGTSE